MNLKKTSKKVGFVTAISIVAILLGVLFYILNNRDDIKLYGDEKKVKQTEVEILLSKDLDYAYPATPAEVVRLYARILKAFYDEEMTDEQFKKLVKQERILFDEELLSINDIDTFSSELKEEIKQAHADKKTIALYNIQDKELHTTYKDTDGVKYAFLALKLTVRSKTGIESLYEQFVLREDENNHYKIVGWRKTTEDVFENGIK